jgi:hypothetical protein
MAEKMQDSYYQVQVLLTGPISHGHCWVLSMPKALQAKSLVQTGRRSRKEVVAFDISKLTTISCLV